MGDAVNGILRNPRTTRGVFFILFLTLGCLMFGGSHLLGQEVPSSQKLEFWRSGMPHEFDYLSSKALEPAAAIPHAADPSGRTAKSLIVLLYHGIRERPTADLVGWENFKNQMYALKAAGYETVDSAQVLDFLLRGQPLPEKSFLLTFDDGRKDSYYPADPILQALNYRALIFIITSAIAEDDDFYLTEGELKAMTASGRWELGSHGHDIHRSAALDLAGATGHALSNKLWLPEAGRAETDAEYGERIILDLSESKNQLESRFGATVRSFSYPYGDYGQNSVNHPAQAVSAVQDAVSTVYDLAFYQPWGEAIVRNYPGMDGFMVRRLEVKPEWTAATLLTAVRGGEDKPGDFSTAMAEDPGWTGGWGDATFSPGKLTVSAAPDTTGASTYLDGTYLWTDFELTLRGRLLRGESFSILARVDRNKDFVFCSFGPNGVSYGESVGGTVLEGPGWYTDLSLLLGLDVEAGMSVVGNTVRCRFNGVWGVESAFLRHTADHGMIGVSVWGPEKGTGALEVTYLEVRKIEEKDQNL